MPGMSFTRALLVVALLSLIAIGVGHAQGLKNITVYIQNPTSSTLNFSYKKGGDDWFKKQIQSGHTQTFRGIAPHAIRFHNGQKVVSFSLSSSKTCYFSWRNKVLYLYTR